MFNAEYDRLCLSSLEAAADRNNTHWRESTGDILNPAFSLEDEIRDLRLRMEQLFQQEQSFTSEIVIEISSKLDLKINEYMKSASKQR
ncbi:aspartyl-phosphate phosphatase Spo0E family protein [Paenibacillus sp. JX-17]|uniref:Aspartyl-phosphate phosphatase Spo0E family protein n=1 Tax=Paenibacillus lacisoli TaxID=3064525 RepID=A0ABT9CDP7_9BACL|nr:aspartyl-phosphate phosphatase Spo0E family protein [Paenibacillus sp. JX-17]